MFTRCVMAVAVAVATVLVAACLPRAAAQASDLFAAAGDPFSTTVPLCYQVELADLDSDADLDALVLVQFSSLTLVWFEADSLTVGTVFDSSSDRAHIVPIDIREGVGNAPNQFLAADVDNDGDQDLLVVINAHRSLKLFVSSASTQPADKDSVFATERRFDFSLDSPGPGDTTLTSGGESLAVADINLDGYVDVVVLSSDPTIGPLLFMNGGAGAGDGARFNASVPILDLANDPLLPTLNYAAGGNSQLQEAAHVELGDITGDGYPDLVGVDKTLALVWFTPYVPATGAFEDHITIVYWGLSFTAPRSPAFTGPVQARLADLDKDGDVDVVIALSTATAAGRTGNGQVVWMPNDGGDFGWTGSTPPNPDPMQVVADVTLAQSSLDTPTTIRVADMNGDTHLDVLVGSAHPTAGGVNYYESLGGATPFGDGTFSGMGPNSGVVTSRYAAPIAVAVGDINGDGFKDVLTARSLLDPSDPGDLGEIGWVANDAPPPTFQTPASLLPFDGSFQSLIDGPMFTADVDGDGAVDVVMARVRSADGVAQCIVVSGAEGNAVTELADDAVPLAATDMDQDGDVDVLLVHTATITAADTSPVLLWLPNNGDGTFATAVTLFLHDELLLPGGARLDLSRIVAVVADATNDGVPDVVAVYRAPVQLGGATYMTVSAGVGGESDPAARFPATTHVFKVGFGQGLLLGSEGLLTLLVADVNGDTHTDILAVDKGMAAGVAGTGTATWATDIANLAPAVGGGAASLGLLLTATFADVNGDGAADLLLSPSAPVGGVRYLASVAGAPGFSGALADVFTGGDAAAEGVALLEGPEEVANVALLDVTADGVLDLAVVRVVDGAVRVVPGTSLNPEAPAFASDDDAAAVLQPVVLNQLRAVTYADMDGDGDADVVAVDADGLSVAESFQGLTFRVDAATGSDSGCIADPTTPCATLGGALQLRNGLPGATVSLDLGATPVSLASSLSISAALAERPLRLVGSGAAVVCPSSAPCIDVDGIQDGAVTLAGITLAFLPGGAASMPLLRVTDSAVRLVGVTFTGGFVGSAVTAASSEVSAFQATFTGLTGLAGAAAIDAVDSHVAVSDSTFADVSTFAAAAGAVSVRASQPLATDAASFAATDTTFTTVSTASGDGGVVAAEGATVTLTRTAFTTCSAVAGRGGVLFATRASDVTLEDVTSDGASAATGGFLFADYGTVVRVAGADHTASVASAPASPSGAVADMAGNGGVYVVHESLASTTLADVTARDCHATNHGGVMFLGVEAGRTVAVTNLNATRCTAITGNGGAVYWLPDPSAVSGSSLALDGVVEECAAAAGGGGAVFARELSIATYTATALDVAGNTAAYGPDFAAPFVAAAVTAAPLGAVITPNFAVATVHTGVPQTLATLQLLDRLGQVVTTLSDGDVCAVASPMGSVAPPTFGADAGVVTLADVRLFGLAFGSAPLLTVACGSASVAVQATVDTLSMSVDVAPTAPVFPSPGRLELPVAPAPTLSVAGAVTGPVGTLLEDVECDVAVGAGAGDARIASPVTTYRIDATTGQVVLDDLRLVGGVGTTVPITVSCDRPTQAQELQAVHLDVELAPLAVEFVSAPNTTLPDTPLPLVAHVVHPVSGALAAGDNYTVCTVHVAGEGSPRTVGATATAVNGVLQFEAFAFSGHRGFDYVLSLVCAVGASPEVAVPAPSTVAVAVQACLAGERGDAARPEVCVQCPAGEFGVDGRTCGPCPPGHYNEQLGSTVCQECPRGTFNEVPGALTQGQCLACATKIAGDSDSPTGSDSPDDCFCRAGSYEAERPTDPAELRQCLACLDSMDCDTPGATLETLVVRPGFWRQLATSANIRECRLEGVCVGGVVSDDSGGGGGGGGGGDGASRRRVLFEPAPSDAQCRRSHTGPLCELCQPGHGPDENQLCQACDDVGYVTVTTSGWIAFGVVCFIVLCVVLRCVYKRRKRARATPTNHLTPEQLKEKAAAEKARLEAISALTSRWVVKGKLAVAFLQVSTVMTTSYDIDYPNVVDDVASYFDFVNLSLFSFVRVGCKATDFDQFDRLLVVTLIPIGLVVLFAAIHTAMRCLPVYEWTRNKWQLGSFTAILSVTFLSYPIVAREVVQTFRCTKFDNGDEFLEIDFRVDCKSDRYDQMFWYSVAMFIVFILGVPLFYLGTLYRVRNRLYRKNAGRIITVSHDDNGSTLFVDPERFTSLDHTLLRERVRVAAFQIEVKRRDTRSRFQALLPRLRQTILDKPLDGGDTPTPKAGDGGADVETGMAKPMTDAEREAKAAATLARAFGGGGSGTPTSFADIAQRAARKSRVGKRTMVREVVTNEGTGRGDKRYHFVFPTRNQEERDIVDGLAWQWHRLRYDVKSDVKAREEDQGVFHLKLLYEDYEPRFWYFEVLELVRKFLLTGLALLFMPESASQIVFALIIVLLTAVTVLKVRPYLFPLDNTAVAIAHWALFAQLFAGLLLKVDIAEEDGYDVDVLGILIACIIVAVPVLVVCAAVMELASVVWEDYIENRPDVDEWQLFLLPFLQRWGIVCRCGKPPQGFRTDAETMIKTEYVKTSGAGAGAGGGSEHKGGLGMTSPTSQADNPLDIGTGSSPSVSDEDVRKAAARAKLRFAFKKRALKMREAAAAQAAAGDSDAANTGAAAPSTATTNSATAAPATQPTPAAAAAAPTAATDAVPRQPAGRLPPLGEPTPAPAATGAAPGLVIAPAVVTSGGDAGTTTSAAPESTTSQCSDTATESAVKLADAMEVTNVEAGPHDSNGSGSGGGAAASAPAAAATSTPPQVDTGGDPVLLPGGIATPVLGSDKAKPRRPPPSDPPPE